MTTHSKRVWLVCYDIANDKRLRKVYKLCRGYGEHLQYSVFRCVLSDLRLAEMKARLLDVVDERQDQVMFAFLGTSDADRAWRIDTIGIPFDDPERVVRVV
ncbi:MAG: CRISPR-associated endonuclease Cas2 [Deltaproteobacteria bacterium]|nr:CRISPR-associated endonuclease Cas2 [Deltaproteobacteria bacterium]